MTSCIHGGAACDGCRAGRYLVEHPLACHDELSGAIARMNLSIGGMSGVMTGALAQARAMMGELARHSITRCRLTTDEVNSR